MARRSYQQNCALARAEDLIGDRWTKLLLRDLLVAPRRFNELLRSQKGIGTNLLASRLKDLEAAGLIEHRVSDRHYALTERGRALEPAILAMIRWGLTHGPGNQPGDHHHDDWDLLALKSLFQPERVGEMTVAVQFKANELHGWARIGNQQMQIGLGDIDNADITVEGTVKNLFLDTRNPPELLAHGTPERLQQFMTAFALRA